MKLKTTKKKKKEKQRKTNRQTRDTLLLLIKFLIAFSLFKLSILLKALLFGICYLATN